MARARATPEQLRVEAEEARLRKERREEERREARRLKAEAHAARRARLRQRLGREILHAGVGVSSQLTEITSDAARLEAAGLPVLHDAADLAEFLGLEMRTLRWLTFHRDVARTTHYRQFQIPKAHGKLRTISAPRPRLRAAQQRIRQGILEPLSVTPQAHAFVRGRSTLTHARPHLRQGVVVKLDLEDFFGTITFPRVRGFFRARGYSGMVASLLALLCSEARRLEADLDGVPHYVALGPRALPQGAPTSPALSNLIARRLDQRLSGYARAQGWVYTRYADDLAFSRPESAREPVGRLLAVVDRVVRGEGFRLNPAKRFVSRAGRQQRITGLVVNHTLGIPRVELRRFRAAVHRVGREGFRDPGERARMLGYASYVHMVKPALGQRFLDALRGGPRAD